VAKCDRCDSHGEVPNEMSVGCAEKDEFQPLLICDECYCKALQFIEGHDALEDIPLEDFSSKSGEEHE